MLRFFRTPVAGGEHAGPAHDDGTLTAYAVSDAASIHSILQSLQRRRTLLTVRPHGQADSAVTQVLHVASDTLTLDYASRPEDNKLLLRATGARVEGRHGDVPVSFDIATPAPCTFEGRLALAVPPPRVVQRYQRREHFRVHVPMARAALCLLPAAEAAGQVRARVVDVSCGGVALTGDFDRVAWAADDVLRPCELRLPAHEALAVALAAVRAIPAPGRRSSYLGFRFVGLHGRAQQVVQRYVDTLQRDALRRAS